MMLADNSNFESIRAEIAIEVFTPETIRLCHKIHLNQEDEWRR